MAEERSSPEELKKFSRNLARISSAGFVIAPGSLAITAISNLGNVNSLMDLALLKLAFAGLLGMLLGAMVFLSFSLYERFEISKARLSNLFVLFPVAVASLGVFLVISMWSSAGKIAQDSVRLEIIKEMESADPKSFDLLQYHLWRKDPLMKVINPKSGRPVRVVDIVTKRKIPILKDLMPKYQITLEDEAVVFRDNSRIVLTLMAEFVFRLPEQEYGLIRQNVEIARTLLDDPIS